MKISKLLLVLSFLILYQGLLLENFAQGSGESAQALQIRVELDKEIERLRERLKDFVVDFEDSADLTFAIGQIAMERKVAALSIGRGDKRAASKTPV